MTDTTRRVEFEVEVITSLTGQKIKSEVEEKLGVAWDLDSGMITKTVEEDVPVDAVDVDGVFHDSLYEEAEEIRQRENLEAEFRDALKSAVDEL